MLTRSAIRELHAELWGHVAQGRRTDADSRVDEPNRWQCACGCGWAGPALGWCARWRSAMAAGDRRQTAGSGRPGQQTEGRRWQTVGDLAGPPTQPADASELPLQQHQRRKGAGYAARAAM